MNRRDYIQKFLLGGSVLVLAPSVLQSCSKDDEDPGPGPGNGGGQVPGGNITLDLSAPENASLNNAGGSRIVQSVLIINTGSGFTALTSICTHEGCTVGYNSSANKIQCPCHGSEYSITGSVIMGPAPAPLERYSVSRTDNILTIVV